MSKDNKSNLAWFFEHKELLSIYQDYIRKQK